MDSSFPIDRHLGYLFAIAFAAVILSGLFYLGGKAIEVRPPARPAITGSGEGKVTAKPDTAEIALGVQTGRQPTAERAMEILTQRMSAVFTQLKRHGVEDKDISTTALSLYPAYDWEDGRQIPKGFEASENAIVTVRDIANVGQMISASTRAGANQVTGVRFYLQDIATLRRQARAQAIANAKDDAAQIAGELGAALGRLAEITEQPSGPSRAQFLKGEGAGGGSDTVPSGEQQLAVTVSLTYELR